MQLVNLSNHNVLADHVEVANTFKRRLRGLIGKTCLHDGEALILIPCSSIHTCFMNFPIDVLFADQDAMILQTLENMRPFRFTTVIPRSYMAIELPAGRIAATGTETGHRLQLLIKEAAS